MVATHHNFSLVPKTILTIILTVTIIVIVFTIFIFNSHSTIDIKSEISKMSAEYYEKYYDNILIPESIDGAHPKLAITLKNRWMVEQSDLVIVNVEDNKGGAYMAMKYAEKINRKIVNICDIEHN